MDMQLETKSKLRMQDIGCHCEGIKHLETMWTDQFNPAESESLVYTDDDWPTCRPPTHVRVTTEHSAH